MTDEKGSILLVINLLARALAMNDRDAVALAATQLTAVFGEKP